MTNYRSNWYARRRVKPSTAGRQIGDTGLYVAGPNAQTQPPMTRSAQKKAAGRSRTTTQRKRAVARKSAATSDVARNIDGSPVISVGSRASSSPKVIFHTPKPQIKETLVFGSFAVDRSLGKGTEALQTKAETNPPKTDIKSLPEDNQGFIKVVSKSTRRKSSVPKGDNQRGLHGKEEKRGRLPLIRKEDLPPQGCSLANSTKVKEILKARPLKEAWVVKGSCKVAPGDPLFPTDKLHSRFVPTMSRKVEFVTREEGDRTFGYWQQSEASQWRKKTAWFEGRRFDMECDEDGDVFVNGVWRLLSSLNYGSKVPYGILKDLGWHIYADDTQFVTLKHRGKLGTYHKENERVALTIFAQNCGFLSDEVKTLAPPVGEGFCYLHWFWEAAFLHNYNLSLEGVRRKLGKYPHMKDVVSLFLKIFPFLKHWGFRCEKVEGKKGLLHANLLGPNHIMIDSYGPYKVGGKLPPPQEKKMKVERGQPCLSEKRALEKKANKTRSKGKRRALRKKILNVSPPGEGRNRIQKLLRKDYKTQGLQCPSVEKGNCFFSILDRALASSHTTSKRKKYAGLGESYHLLRRQSTLRYQLAQLGVSNVISVKSLWRVLYSIDKGFDFQALRLIQTGAIHYHFVPSWQLCDLNLSQLLKKDPDALIGMDYSTFDLELSRVMSDTTEKVKNMQVKDSVALRAVEGAVLAELNFSKSLYDAKPTVVVPYKVEENQQRLIVNQFPELKLKFTHSILNTHATAAIARLCYNHLLKYRFSEMEIIDIGGDVRFHVQNSLNKVHVCNPIIDVKDASRYTSRNIDWERTYSREVTKAISGKANVTFCYKNALDCDYRAKVGVAVEVYDLSIDDIASIMMRREIDIIHLVLVCPGELLDETNNDVPVPDLGIVIKHSEDNCSLNYFMPEGLGYSHNKDKVLSFFRNPVFVKEGQLFHCELVGTRLSINEFKMTRNKSYSAGCFSIPISVPRATANLVAIRIPDWKKRGTFLNKNFSNEIMVDRTFFIRAIQYVMGITSSVNDKTFEYVTTWLRNNSARIVISGKVIHQDVHIDTKFIEKVAAILLVIGARKKTLGTKYARKLNISAGGDLPIMTLLKERVSDAYSDFLDKMQVLAKVLFPFLGLIGDLDVDSLYRECDKTTNIQFSVLVKENGEPVIINSERENIEEHVDKSIGRILENQVKREADYEVFVPSMRLRGSATRGDPGCGLKAGAKGDTFFLDFIKNWVNKCCLKGFKLFCSFLDLLDNLMKKVSEKLSKGIAIIKSILTFFTPDSSWGDALTLGLSEIIYQSVIFLWDVYSGKGVFKSFFSLVTRVVGVFSTHNFFFKNQDGSIDVFLQSAVVSTMITLFERKLIGDEGTYAAGILKALIGTGILRAIIRYHLILWTGVTGTAYGPHVLSSIDSVENYQVLVEIFKRSLVKVQDFLEGQIHDLLLFATTTLSTQTRVGKGLTRALDIKDSLVDRIEKVREWLGFKRSFSQAIPSTEFLSQTFDVAENDEDFKTVRPDDDSGFEDEFHSTFGFNEDGSVQGGGSGYTSLFSVCKRKFLKIFRWARKGVVSLCRSTLEVLGLTVKYGWRLVIDVLTTIKLDRLYRKISTCIIEDCEMIMDLGTRTLGFLDKFFPGAMTFACYIDIMTKSKGYSLVQKVLLVNEIFGILALSLSGTARALRKVVFTLYLNSLPPNLALYEYDPSSPYNVAGMPSRLLLTRSDGVPTLPIGGARTFTVGVFSRVQGSFSRRMTGGFVIDNRVWNPLTTAKTLLKVLKVNVSFLLLEMERPLRPFFDLLRILKRKGYSLYFDFFHRTSEVDGGEASTDFSNSLTILDEDFVEARLTAEIRNVYLRERQREIYQAMDELDLVPGNGGSVSLPSLPMWIADRFKRGLTLILNILSFLFYGTIICTYEGGLTSELLDVGILILKGLCFGFGWFDLGTALYLLREHFPWTIAELQHKLKGMLYPTRACPVVEGEVSERYDFPKETYQDILGRISQGMLSLRKATQNLRRRRDREISNEVIVEKYRRELEYENPSDISTTDTSASSESDTTGGNIDDFNPSSDDLLSSSEKDSEDRASLVPEIPIEDTKRSESTKKKEKKKKKKGGRELLGKTPPKEEMRPGRSIGDFVLEKASQGRDSSIYRCDHNKLNFQVTTFESVQVPPHGSEFQKTITQSGGAIIPPPDYSKLNPLSLDINEYIYNRVLELCQVLRTVQGVWASLKNSNFQHEIVIESLDPHVSLFSIKDCKVINKGNVKPDDFAFDFCFDGTIIRPFRGRSENLRVSEPFLVLHEDLRVFYSELFLRRFPKAEYVNYDFSFHESFFVVESPPGGGKTTELIATFVEFFAKGLEVRIVTANKNSKEEIITKVLALLTHRGICEIKSDVEVMMRDRIRTADSYCMNIVATAPVDVLFVDELFMLHSGQVSFIVQLLKARFAIGYGDSNQIGFINRIDLQVSNFSDINDTIRPECRSYRNISYRCPVDVCLELSERYGRKILPANNPRTDTMEIKPIRCSDDFEFEDGVKYITFTQGEKLEINKALGKSKVSCENAQTIHEVQGNTYQHVRLVRIKPQDDPVFTSQPHITVALSRHVESFRYYVINVKLNDSTCERINRSKELSKIASDIADSTPYIEAKEDTEYLEEVNNKPVEGLGPPGSSTISAFQDFLEEVVPGTTLTTLGNLSAELSTTEFKSVVDRIKIKANTYLGKKPLEPRSQRV